MNIKKLNLKIVNDKTYMEKAFLKGIPIEGLINLQNQLFALFHLQLRNLIHLDFLPLLFFFQDQLNVQL